MGQTLLLTAPQFTAKKGLEQEPGSVYTAEEADAVLCLGPIPCHGQNGAAGKGKLRKSCLHLEATGNPLLTQTRVDLEYWMIYSLGPKGTAT